MKDVVERLRARLVTIPKPGTEPRTMAPGEWLTCSVGGEHKAGDDAGEQQLPNYSTLSNAPWRVQPHIYAVEPLCAEAADLIERLRAELAKANELLAGYMRMHVAGIYSTNEEFKRDVDERDSLRLDAERLRAALLMMKHAFESDNRPNMLIVNAALSAAHGTEGKT